jgi:hypothetical protein
MKNLDGHQFISDLGIRSRFTDSSIYNTSVNNIKIKNTYFYRVDFRMCEFVNCEFINCEFVECEFRECVWRDNTFNFGSTKTCYFIEGDFSFNKYSYSIISGCDFKPNTQANNIYLSTLIKETEGINQSPVKLQCRHLTKVETVGFTGIYIDCKDCGIKLN